MQPGGPFKSVSTGIDWMGSESELEVLDVTVKRLAKKSIIVWVWMRCEACEDREMDRQCV